MYNSHPLHVKSMHMFKLGSWRKAGIKDNCRFSQHNLELTTPYKCVTAIHKDYPITYPQLKTNMCCNSAHMRRWVSNVDLITQFKHGLCGWLLQVSPTGLVSPYFHYQQQYLSFLNHYWPERYKHQQASSEGYRPEIVVNRSSGCVRHTYPAL